jgi:hypothetical protein
MSTALTHRIYVGIPPKAGLCTSDNTLGIATVTDFIFSATSWTSSNTIIAYNFYFSVDGGNIYIPIEKLNTAANEIDYIFPSVYQDVTVLI